MLCPCPASSTMGSPDKEWMKSVRPSAPTQASKVKNCISGEVPYLACTFAFTSSMVSERSISLSRIIHMPSMDFTMILMRPYVDWNSALSLPMESEASTSSAMSCSPRVTTQQRLGDVGQTMDDGKPAYGIRHTSRTEEQKGNGKPISTLSFYKYEGQMSKANYDDPS